MTAAVVIAGDLVNVWQNETQGVLFGAVWPAEFGAVPTVALTPGNHDVNANAGSDDYLTQQVGGMGWGRYVGFRPLGFRI